MTNEEKLKELKSQAYDCIAIREQQTEKLLQLNQEILKLMQPPSAPVLVPDPPSGGDSK